MNTTLPSGRVIYALAMLFFGLQFFITRSFPIALFPLPGAFPGRLLIVLCLGIALTAASLCILTLRKAGLAAQMLGFLWLLAALTLHAPELVKNPHNANKWTVFSELAALSGGAFYLAGALETAMERLISRRFNGVVIGQFMFAGSLIIFGVLHLMYAAFIATLIPAWIPGRLFWAYFVGVGFLATAISLLIRKQVPVATNLLGLMFLLWVIGLHAPRVIAKPQIEPEWTSLFIALAMSGISFIIARFSSQNNVVEWY